MARQTSTQQTSTRQTSTRQILAQPILVVDDDPHIREVICFALEKAGLPAIEARDGAEALALFAERAPRLVILDVGMPEIDGLEVCRRIRRADDTPILFLSARDEEIDRILGLEMGGDDYVAKPFSPRELTARVNAILKRAAPRAVRAEGDPPLGHGGLTLDPARFAATFDGRPASLTGVEFAMMKALLARPGVVLSRERLVAEVYADRGQASVRVHVSDRTIDSHIRNIRVKFAAIGCAQAIETVHGVGFRLGACEPSS